MPFDIEYLRTTYDGMMVWRVTHQLYGTSVEWQTYNQGVSYVMVRCASRYVTDREAEGHAKQLREDLRARHRALRLAE